MILTSWQDTTIALATAVYAGVSLLLLGGVISAFMQLRLLQRGQQREALESWVLAYRSADTMRHVSSFISWARAHGEDSPFYYCELHAAQAPEFMNGIHNDRRHMSHIIAMAARFTTGRFFDENFVLSLAGGSLDDARFLIGVEWRLARQIDAWDHTIHAETFRAWALMELFISRATRRMPKRYGQFRRKQWWTPVAWLSRRAEARYRGGGILPRYRSFLEAMKSEDGYGVWATAALRAVDEELRESELRRASETLLPQAVGPGLPRAISWLVHRLHH